MSLSLISHATAFDNILSTEFSLEESNISSNSLTITYWNIQGYTFFPLFALKHRLWVMRFLRVPTIYVLSENKKKYLKKKQLSENCHFYCCEKLQYNTSIGVLS